MKGFRYLSGGATLALEEHACNGCGVCTQVCPHGVLEVRDRRATIVDREACMECGACAKNCSFGAITVRQGVGCAAAVINGWIRRSEPNCDCGPDSGC